MLIAGVSDPFVSFGAEPEENAASSQSEERELEANEDPLGRRSASVASSRFGEWDAEAYGSIRVRYRRSRSDDLLEDFGSRVGADGWYETAPNRWLLARFELGFNLLEELEIDSPPTRPDQEIGRTVFTRLGYLGMQFGENIIAAGKNWSTYYQIAAFTDRFDSVGGEASGAFNAQTDGGASGTGRADGVFQGRFRVDVFGERAEREPLEINLQVQTRQEIPGLNEFEYDQAFGVSSILEIASNIDIGVAYSRSTIDIDQIPVDQRNGLDGDLSALLLGARWYNDDWYLGATWSRTSNLHTTDASTFFDGEGVELYGQYRVMSNVWLLAGMNRLKPDSNQIQAGEYRLKYGVLGIRYLFAGFTRMIYLESRISSGRNEDGTADSDQVILGVRWGFSATKD